MAVAQIYEEYLDLFLQGENPLEETEEQEKARMQAALKFTGVVFHTEKACFVCIRVLE
jgi:hypothetical protein